MGAPDKDGRQERSFVLFWVMHRSFRWMRVLRLLLLLAGFVVIFALMQALGAGLYFWLSGGIGTFDMLERADKIRSLYAVFLPIVLFGALALALVKLVYLRRPIDRVVVISGAYAAPVLVPFIGGALLGLVIVWVNLSAAELLLYFVWLWVYWAGLVAALALISALPAIIYAELRSVRSLPVHVVAGAAYGVLAGFVGYLYAVAGRSLSADVLGNLIGWLLVAAVIGSIFGVVYWAIAGRNAGATRTDTHSQPAGTTA